MGQFRDADSYCDITEELPEFVNITRITGEVLACKIVWTKCILDKYGGDKVKTHIVTVLSLFNQHSCQCDKEYYSNLLDYCGLCAYFLSHHVEMKEPIVFSSI